MAGLALAGIRKDYGRLRALDEVSLEVADGEFCCLLGPSGAGKTTTLKVVAGLEEPTAGTVRIGGADVTDVEPTHRNLAMCFESYALYPQQDVFTNLVSPLRSPRHRLPEAAARRRVEEVAELLGIDALLERSVTQLSNGQRQRVALGRVLVRPAAAYLLDEPLSHLDAKLRATMRAELKAISRERGTTTLYVTHDYVEALSLAERVGVLDAGRIRQVGTPRQVWEEPADIVVARSFGRPAINVVSGVVADVSGPRFLADDGALDLPLPGRRVRPGTHVQLGIRPRDLALHRGAGDVPASAVRVEGTVYVLEHLGRQAELTVRVGSCLLALVVPRTQVAGLGTDDRVVVTVNPQRVHVFLADDSGRRVETPQVTEAAG
ncbi:ABC transporter ATP-binding protein [Actinopolymorpha rutila]|uniref:ABC-type sugar transport system ATPase subunit n=1 Tax=Actinopolymorpha rutila TaxID=446787 RepID=A0A852ZBC7_9ACTN|nr:ABC transporter ATP-binding protein [Actinopolymorpha rutila]NYH89112.1 ABC-type sugar transport system ATPase subunit [Actinopolymorpha rutila]